MPVIDKHYSGDDVQMSKDVEELCRRYRFNPILSIQMARADGVIDRYRCLDLIDYYSRMKQREEDERRYWA
jgi:hypothetical protein